MRRGLSDETIDAAFLTGPIPFPPVEMTLRHKDAHLIPLRSQLIDRLVDDGRYYALSIPKGTYVNQSDEVPTVGVRTLLLARNDVNPAVVDSILRILQDDQNEIEKTTGVLLHMSLSDDESKLLIPVHATSVRHFGSPQIVSTRIVLLSALVGLLLIALYVKRNTLIKLLTMHKELARILLVAIGIWSLGAIGLFIFERHVNENFSSIPTAAWSMIVSVAGGAQSRVPVTRGGEIVAVMVILFGAALVSWLTAELATHFVGAKFRELYELITGRRSMPESLQDHLVIINWDRRAKQMIKQINGPDFKKHRCIVVISEHEIDIPAEACFKNVIPHIGDVTDEDFLRQASLHNAHSITILSTGNSGDVDQSLRPLDPDVADSRTIMLILLIRALCARANTSVFITAEIKSSKNSTAARHASQGGPIEVVCAEDFGIDVLTQCALTPGLAAVYRDLLTFAPGTNEIYKCKVPPAFSGRGFADLLDHFVGLRKHTNEDGPVIPIGVCRDASVYLNPTEEVIGLLRDGDEIVVVSDHQPNILSKTSGAFGGFWPRVKR